MHLNKLYLSALILVLPIYLSFLACKNNTPPPAVRSIKVVKVISVPEKNVVGYDKYPCSIQGINNNDVRAKISGYIKEVYIDEGQKVGKGQKLFRLETNMLTENANAAQSAISAAEANIAAAKSAVSAAQVEVNKLIPLVEKQIISPIQLETAKANLASAQSRLLQAEAGKNQAMANLNSINANIDYSIIRAPISGTIGSLSHKEGSLVSPSDPTPLTTISDTRQLYAYFSMNESQYLDFLEKTQGTTLAQKLKNLPKVQLILANGATYEQEGSIETVTGQIDPKTGTIQFRALFPNANQLLSNGNTGVIKIPKTFEKVIVIPESATVDQQGIVHVFKVEKDTARSTIVKISERINNMAIVENGLKQGEHVIALGVGSVQNGIPVKEQVISFDSLLNSLKPLFE
ncbi:MAG: efflux RND transporter periplasmic adaptor subunit [Chitinophagales bacterium]|nr:efflux RND transporter periplasmic adaptor subunit [Bacteroidota bacterium]MCB9043234.1 efflux RND transporter periplasmic adaptor subunit [Chitinophagales bacterium]